VRNLRGQGDGHNQDRRTDCQHCPRTITAEWSDASSSSWTQPHESCRKQADPTRSNCHLLPAPTLHRRPYAEPSSRGEKLARRDFAVRQKYVTFAFANVCIVCEEIRIGSASCLISNRCLTPVLSDNSLVLDVAAWVNDPGSMK